MDSKSLKIVSVIGLASMSAVSVSLYFNCSTWKCIGTAGSIGSFIGAKYLQSSR